MAGKFEDYAPKKKLFLVTKQDTVLQATGYFVRAVDEKEAEAYVKEGMYIEETSTVTLDTLDSTTKDIVAIHEDGNGQAL